MQSLYRMPFFVAVLSLVLMMSVPIFAHAQSPGETNRTAPSPEDILASSAARAGDLLVAPTRVVFSGRTRSTEIILKNQGTKPTTYRLALVDLDIDYEGNIAQTDRYEKSAKDYVRFSPRQVTLQPGLIQKVKVLLRKPSNLVTAEYRSHLRFQALPDTSFGQDVESEEVSEGLSVKLVPLVGLSIPVIAQHGELAATANIDASRTGNALNVTLRRSGERSLFGDVYVKQNGQIIANANTSVVLPMTTRRIAIELPSNTTQQNLSVEFVETGADKEKPLTRVTI